MRLSRVYIVPGLRHVVGTLNTHSTLSGPLREATDKPLHNVVVYTGEVTTITAFRIRMCEVLVLVVVFWIKV